MKREELLRKLEIIWLTYDEAMELARLEMEMREGWLNKWEITEETYKKHKKNVDEFKERMQNPHIIPLEEALFIWEDDY